MECMIHCIWRILARVLRVFNEQKILEQIGRHIVSKCKMDEFEGVCVTNFRFMEEILDVPWPSISWKKGKAIKGLCVRIMEL